MSYGMFDGFDGFGALDALKGAAGTALPVVLGAGASFGAAHAVDYFVENPTARQYKWLIGAGVAALAGVALWKFKGDADMGVICGVSGALTSLAIWGNEKIIQATKVKPAGDDEGTKGDDEGTNGLRAFVSSTPRPVLEAFQVDRGQPLLAGMGSAVPSEVVNLGSWVA